MQRYDIHDAGQSHTIWLFGSGTIGSAVANTLEPRASSTTGTPVAWDDTERRRSVLDTQLARSTPNGEAHLIWAAGIAGFAASDDEVAHEMEVFSDVLTACRRIANRIGTRINFHFVSSAGGLFEGRAVNKIDATPEPRRPYGRMKMEQESIVNADPALSTTVYRPSSVFAAPNGQNRPGFIGVLVDAAWHKRGVTITGSPSTLRDYVSARDVGTHIAETVLSPGPATRPLRFLVAGHATALHVVIKRIEWLTRRRVMVEYADAWNSSDIAFAPQVKDPTFRPEPLEVGLTRLFADVRL